jgi:putative DNA primase/helicase
MADTDQAQQPNELEAEQRQAEARERAQQLWHDAESATDDHPYLQSKGVAAHGLKVFHGQLAIGGVSCDGALLVKIRDCAGTIHSVGFITASRQKVHLPGGRKSGCFFSIGGRTDLIVIGRRFTVAASCHEACGCAAAAAFDPENVVEVAKALHVKYPHAQLVIAADNDGHVDHNMGIEAAQAAAVAINGLVAVPRLDGRACDFNDLALEQGLDAVRLAIETAQPPEQAAFDTKLESHAAIEDSHSAEQSIRW